MDVASGQPTAALTASRGGGEGREQYFTQTLCLESSIAQGQTIDKVVSVIDLTGVTMSNASNKHFIALFKQMSKIDSDNYPEVSPPHRSANTYSRRWRFPSLQSFRPPSTPAVLCRGASSSFAPAGASRLRETWARCRWLGALTAVPPTHLRLFWQVMKSVYIINAPWIFSAIFNLIKGFLDPSTQKKIKVCAPCRARRVIVSFFARGPTH
jgi:hypothetical protein